MRMQISANEVFRNSKNNMIQRHFTKEGLEKLKQELEDLRTTKRQEIAERLHEAASHGDLSENFAYQETREEQDRLEARIMELEGIIRSAIITKDAVFDNKAVIGSTVKVKNEERISEFKLVGASEASPLEGKISIESPLGRALVNRKKGETAEFETPLGKKVYEIIEIKGN